MSLFAETQVAGLSLNGRKRFVTYQILEMLALLLDGVAFVFAGVLSFAIYHFYVSMEAVRSDEGLGIGVLSAALFITLARYRKFFHIRVVMSPKIYMKTILLLALTTCFAIVSGMFLIKVEAQVSRGSVVLFGVMALSFVAAGRMALGHFVTFGIRSGMVSGTRAVVIGEAYELERLAPSELSNFGMEEVARIGVAQAQSLSGLSEKGRLRIGEAIVLARELRAVEFVLILPWAHHRLIAEVRDLLRSSPLRVKLMPDSSVRSVVGVQRSGVIDIGLSVEIQREPLNLWERFSKRALDLVLSVSAMILLVPFLTMTALLIRLDSEGPALFRQRRIGFDNREFVIFKFRTMMVANDTEHIVQARRGDSRVTRVGRLLRRSSIDELPQLLNVIRGEMSIVGPRPHAIQHHDEYSAQIATYALRHHVKPGITGMAQIRGLRGETRDLIEMEKRVEQDIWYINHWSLLLDLSIMARTCFALLKQDAY